MSLKYWTMADGEAIAIKDMDDDHLMNTIRMLERNAQGIKDKVILAVLDYEGGEMAKDSLLDDMGDLWAAEPLDIVKEVTPYNSLVWHAKRRGLMGKNLKKISWWAEPLDLEP